MDNDNIHIHTKLYQITFFIASDLDSVMISIC
jgi:hypothetical protein